MTPPRGCRALLARVLPHDYRAVVLQDLDDEFQARGGAAAARWWYRRQACASLPGALRLRLRAAGRGVGGDVRFGLRQLARHRGFALSVTLTLGLGIAAASAVLTLGQAVLLRPLPYRDAARVVSVAEVSRDGTGGNVSWPDFRDFRAGTRTLSAVAAYSGGSRTLQLDGVAADRLPAAMVTGAFFDVLGMRPALGRLLVDDDTRNGAAPVAVLTDGAWRRRFGADPSIVGRTVLLSGVSTAIVGVLPPAFEFPPRGMAELWLPMRPTAAQLERRYMHWMNAIGRVRDGVSVADATAELSGIAAGFATEDPTFHTGRRVLVRPLHDVIVGDVRPLLQILFLAAALVLVVAAANVAGLLLAHGASRAAELSLRAAIGANRLRLVRQLLIESVVLAVPGGVLGIVSGHLAVRAFIAMIPATQRVSLPHLDSLTVDVRVVGFSLALTLLVAGACGLIPAWRMTASAAPTGTRGVVGLVRRDRRTQSLFLAVQIALSLTLLTGAGLLVRSMSHLMAEPSGFDVSRVMTGAINLSGPRYASVDAIAAYHQQVLDAVRAAPGVEAVATIDQPPLAGTGNNGSLRIAGREMAAPLPVALVRTVSANYFETLGLSMVTGRPFAPTYAPIAPREVIVNRTLAESLFGGRAVGQRVSFAFIDNNAPLEIVGVVADERYDALDRGFSPVVYFPYGQWVDGSFSLVVRASVPPAAVTGGVRAAVARIDASVPLHTVYTMEQLLDVSGAVFRRRAVLALLAAFAVAAVVLAAIGVYGMLAQHVARSTRELGVRMALGAGRDQVAGAVLRRAAPPLTLGLIAGLVGSVWLGRELSALLFGVSPADPVTLVTGLAVSLLAAVVAAWVPLRRAVVLDPVTALRGE